MKRPEANVTETIDGRRSIEESIESNLGSTALGLVRHSDKCTPMSFYMPEELGESYTESNWCVRERTRILTAIALDFRSDPRASLAAIALLEKYNWNAVTASGQIQDMKRTTTTDKDGTVTKEDVRVMRMGGLQQVIDVTMVEKESGYEQDEPDEPEFEEEGSDESVERDDDEPEESAADDDAIDDADDDAEPRDSGHKPPKDAFSKGLFREGGE